MNEREFEALCARMNAALDVQDVIQLIDYESERAIRVAGLWRMFCPIHGDTLFRTLVINPRRNTYHCEYSPCEAHQPGDLLDLLMKVRKMTREEIVSELLELYGAQRLRLSHTQESILRHYLASRGQGVSGEG